MKRLGDIPIIDVTGKKSIECPTCGYTLNIPPRTMSMEKLEHMQHVKNWREWRKQHGDHAMGNVRVLICSKCGSATICTDQFSVHV